MNIYLEIFGYIGTCLVIISMLMTSLIKLRLFNFSGSIISLIYALIIKSYPVALLNLCLAGINLFYLLKNILGNKSFTLIKTNISDSSLNYFLKSTICLDLNHNLFNTNDIYLVFNNNEIIGLILSKQKNNKLNIDFEYILPKYQSLFYQSFFNDYLKKQNIKEVAIKVESINNKKHLTKAKFKYINNYFIKRIN